MQIIGVGTEIVECVRIRRLIDRHGEAFLARVFTEQEIRDCQGKRHVTEEFAARWAAKEAVRKCLGGANRGFAWSEVEIRTTPAGKPRVFVRGAARELAQSLRVTAFLVSLAHCRSYATAYATAVRKAKDLGN